MNFTPSTGSLLSEYYVTLGWGTSLYNYGYKLQVNGNFYARDSIYSDGGLSVVGGITSSNGSLRATSGVFSTLISNSYNGSNAGFRGN